MGRVTQFSKRLERLEAIAAQEQDSPARLTFIASIAPLQSAITVASDGGARVKVDIPEEEMPAIVRLMLFRGKVLRITIEEVQKQVVRRGKPRQLTEAEWGDDDGDEEENQDDNP